MHSSTTPAIEVDDLAIEYDGRPILNQFSLRIEPGEKVTLVGASGSGKSTILKCVLGLAVPANGSIKINGIALNQANIWATRLNLGYVAQEPVLAPGTTMNAIEQPFEFKANCGLRKNLQRLPELLEQFNVSSQLLNKTTHTLSGGEKQRIALISAILLERPIMLLDEASAALDSENKRMVAEYFMHADDLTVLSVSHDSEWMQFSNRVVSLEDGK